MREMKMILACLALGAITTGCGSRDREIESAVRQHVDGQPICVTSAETSFPVSYGQREFSMPHSRLGPFVKAGLLIAAEEGGHMLQYSLSETGTESLENAGSFVRFCYAKYRFIAVSEYREPVDGRTSVSFTYDITSFSEWAMKPDAAEALPDVARTLQESQEGPRSGSVLVVKMNKGWKVEG